MGAFVRLLRAGVGVCALSSVVLAGSAMYFENTMNPGDVFSWDVPLSADDVLAAMATPLDSGSPDTMLGAFDSSDTLLALNDDDDAGDNGDFGLASAIRLLAPADDIYSLRLTGFDDFGFDGSHTQSGAYAMTFGVVPAAPGGDFADSANNGSAATADLLGISAGQAAIARNTFDSSGGDVDFYAVSMQAGQVLTAMTAPMDDPNFLSPDTILAVFDTDGTTQLLSDDDAGAHDPNDGYFSDYGSALRFVAPANGTYYLAITGYSDFNFSGDHTQVGDYGLLVGLVPEPGSVALLAAGAMLLLLRRRA